MERRKFIIGAGALATGSAAAVGTGAFSSVEAERTIDINTTDDSGALLTIEQNSEYEGDAGDYVSETGDGLFEIDIDSVNKEAVTTFENLFVVTNTGGQDLNIFVKNDFGSDDDPIRGSGDGNDGPVDILYNGDSIVGGNISQSDAEKSLDSGESVELTVEVDTRGLDDDDELNGEYQIDVDEVPWA